MDGGGTRVVSRNSVYLLLPSLGVLFGAGLAVGMVAPARRIEFALAALACVAWIPFVRIPRIVADDDGLEVCGRHPRRIRWHEITDLEERNVGHGIVLSVVHTATGNVTFDRNWTNHARLRTRIAARAVNAPTPAWGEVGERVVEAWPLVFDYRATRDVAVTLAIAIVANVAWTWWTRPWRIAHVPPYMDPLAIYAFFGGTYLVLLAAPWLGVWMSSIVHRAVRPRLAQRIEATADGLTFRNGARCITATWSEIVAVHPPKERPYAWRVETTRGSFDFVQPIRNVRVLARLLETRASVACERGREGLVDVENLGPPVVSGATVTFHYRTRTSRASLALGLSVVAMFTYVAIQRDDRGGAILAVIVGLPMAWAWWGRQVSRVTIDAHGITRHGRIGSRTIAWREVTAVRQRGEDAFTWFVIEGARERLSFNLLLYRVGDLCSYIASFVPADRFVDWEKLPLPRPAPLTGEPPPVVASR